MKVNSETIRIVVRLKLEQGLSERQIGSRAQIGKGTVNRLLNVIKESCLTIDLINVMDDKQLLELFYPKHNNDKSVKARPDWQSIHVRLAENPHRSIFHEFVIYKKDHQDDGMEYSWFTTCYKKWCNDAHVKAKLARNEIPGKRMYVDWAGDTLEVKFEDEQSTSTIYFFVTSIGASEYLYVEPFRDMTMSSFVRGHVNALKYYGGVPEIMVPDNCKTAIISNIYKEFELNKLYEDMQEHYGYVVDPARVKAPSDKNDVEAGVYHAEDWIISELNVHLDEYSTFSVLWEECRNLLNKLNQHDFDKTGIGRDEWFEKVDKPLLKPLPKRDFEIYAYRTMVVPRTYMVSLPGERHKYSVPYQYIGKSVTLKYNDRIIRVYNDKKELIAEWDRHYELSLDKFHVIPEHRPVNHQIAEMYGTKVAEDYIEFARQIGPNTEEFIRNLIASKPHPEQAYRACMGIITLCWSKAGENRISYSVMEEICREANQMHSYSYKTIESLLKAKHLGRYKQKSIKNETQDDSNSLVQHSNIRGKDTYK